MISIIIYVTDITYLNKTINSILNNTHKSLINEIIICDDTGVKNKHNYKSFYSDHIGYAQAYNLACDNITSDILIFIKDKTKFSQDWIYPILKDLRNDYKSLISPVVHTLSLDSWSSEPSCWSRFGWRWDLNIYDKPNNSNQSPAISSYFIACTSKWFQEIGKFDNGMRYGSGADIEMSLRTWLFGGSVIINNNSHISVGLDLEYGQYTNNNNARTLEAWVPKHANKYYEAINDTPDTGKINNLLDLKNKQTKSIDWFIETLQPELGSIYDLRNKCLNKTIAIVGYGVSLNHIDKSIINRNDIIIGVDYAAEFIECDYIITDSLKIIEKYRNNKFITPNVILNPLINKIVQTNSIISSEYQYEVSDTAIPSNNSQPFIDIDDTILTAIHLSLFLKPRLITIYGYDSKCINNETYFGDISKYKQNAVLCNKKSAHILNILSDISQKIGIPILNMSYV